MVAANLIRRALIAALLLAHATLAWTADTWVEVKSENFTVISNDSERKARDMAWQFEQIRTAIEKGWPWARVKLARPLLVIAAKDENTMKGLLPGFWEKRDQIRPSSFFMTGPDRYYIALRGDLRADDREGINPYSSAYWSYSTLALQANFSRGLPLWLVTGMSAVLSNSIVRENEIQFGRPTPGIVRTVQNQPRLSLPDLLAVNGQSAYYRESPTRGRYDAQCWALVQYLLFKQGQGTGEGLNEVARLLVEGTPSDVALQKVYGDLEALNQAAMLYVKNGIFSYSRLRVDTDMSTKKYPSRAFTPAEAAAARAGFLAETGRLAEARTLLAEARQADPNLAAAYEADGVAFDRERKTEAARQAFAKAAELNSSNFFVYYRLANLLNSPNADAATLANVQRLLSKAIDLNDSFAPAFTFLANVLARQNQPGQALGLVERAVLLEPGQLPYRIQLANLLARVQRRDDALKVANGAMEFARTDQERQSVQTLITNLTRGGGPGAGARANTPPIGVVGGVAGGGVVGGVAAVPPPPPGPPPAPPQAPIRVGGNIKAPTRTKNVNPVYPDEAKQARVQGVVILDATIDVDGRVSVAKVLRSIPQLDAAAIDAVRQWEFTQTLLNGVPVPVIMTVTVNFSLQ